MSRRFWNNMVQALFATFMAIVLYVSGIISTAEFVAFVVMLFLVFVVGWYWKGRHYNGHR